MGPDRGTHIRNIAIIVALAAIVWLVPGGEAASLTISNVLSIAFVAGLMFLAYRLYMENRATILGLEERQRGLLYGGLALLTVALVGTRRMWDAGGAGALVWLVLMAVALWAIYSVWRAYRAY